MATANHKGAQRALEQAITAERAKLVSAHAVQKCLYEVLLYAEGEGAVVYAALLQNLCSFIPELGHDFTFVGSEYPVQVGNQDFAIDLLFFHRGLSCLVAFELKVREFEPDE